MKGFTESCDEWKYLRTATKEEIDEEIEYVYECNLKTLKKPDNNSTILIANDKNDKIKAAFTLESFDEFKELKDTKTGYIAESLVDKEFRKTGIGSKILNKLLEAANGESNPIIKSIANIINDIRQDSSQVVLVSKSLNPKNPWHLRIYRKLLIR